MCAWGGTLLVLQPCASARAGRPGWGSYPTPSGTQKVGRGAWPASIDPHHVELVAAVLRHEIPQFRTLRCCPTTRLGRGRGAEPCAASHCIQQRNTPAPQAPATPLLCLSFAPDGTDGSVAGSSAAATRVHSLSPIPLPAPRPLFTRARVLCPRRQQLMPRGRGVHRRSS